MKNIKPFLNQWRIGMFLMWGFSAITMYCKTPLWLFGIGFTIGIINTLWAVVWLLLYIDWRTNESANTR